MEEIISARYKIKSNEENITKAKINHIEPIKTVSDGLYPEIFISNLMEKLKVVYSSKSESKAYLHIGNDHNRTMDYAVVGLLNWEQTPVINNKEIAFFSVKENSRNIYDLHYPDTGKREKNFQLIAFPLPYKINGFYDISRDVYSSFRTVIEP